MTNSAKSKIDLLPNNSSSFQGAARRGGHPVRRRPGHPAVRWSVSSRREITDQESDGRWTHEDGSRTCLGAVLEQHLGCSVVPGSTRCLQLTDRCGLAQDRILRCGLVPAARSGGDEETRTPDPLLAKEMLCQLSYVPSDRKKVWWAFLDSNQRPLPYQGSALTS